MEVTSAYGVSILFMLIPVATLLVTVFLGFRLVKAFERMAAAMEEMSRRGPA